MFDLQTEAAKQRWALFLVRKMMRNETGLRVGLLKIFSHQAEKAAALVENGVTRVDRVIDADNSMMAALLVSKYRAVAATFGEDVFAELAKDKSFGEREQKSSRDDFWRAFNQWAQQQAADRVARVSAVTKRLIAREIGRAQRYGMSYGETAAMIRKKVPELSVGRSARIARTEVHTGAVLAVDKAVASTRLKFEREWLTVLDERTRIDHVRANGQRRGMTEVFDVGGEKLMHPGDPRGSAANIINCRCVLLYHRIKAVQRRAA